MDKKVLLISLILCGFSLFNNEAKANNTKEDFRIWGTFNLNVRATKAFHVNLAVEGRFYNLMTDDMLQSEGNTGKPGFGLLRTKLEGKYKVCKYFSAASGYTLFYSPMDAKLPEHKLYHRIDLEGTGMYSFSGVSLSLRERLQTDIKNLPMSNSNIIISDPSGKPLDLRKDIAYFSIRSCFKVAYKIPKTKFSPYLSVELFNGLNYNNLEHDNGSFFNQVRTSVGTTFKFDSNNTLNVFFLAQTLHKEVTASAANLVLGVAYTFGCSCGVK